MAKNHKKQQPNRKSAASSPQNQDAGAVSAEALNYAHNVARADRPATRVEPPAIDGVSTPVFMTGLTLLAIAIGMTLMLTISHFKLVALPGCGEGGGCAEVTRGYWGKVPGTDFPTSFVGLAYFISLLAAWSLSKRGLPVLLKYVVRLGAAGSVFFIAIMLKDRHLCWYCLLTHLANFGFLVLIEVAGKPLVQSMRAVGALAGVFVVACAGLFSLNRAHTERVQERLNTARLEDEKKIIEASRAKETPAVTQVTPVQETPQANAQQTQATPPPVENREPFTGRYRLGPEAAPVRMLMITDYQCPDCRAVENVARRLIEQHPDVSLSIKHFPFDASCNRHMSRTMHGNACWAARAAEAAGILRGNEGFWEMHHWLFDRRGAFTDAELNEGLAQMGYDPQEFIQIMTGPQTLEFVNSDIEEGHEVAVLFTPMIFINGIHLRGVFEQNADKLRQTVESLLSQNLPALTAAHDQKPTGIETCIGDWKEEMQRRLPSDSHPWMKGPPNAKVQIVVMGDYQEEGTALADRAIVKWMSDKQGVSYSFRHFPFNQTCNPVVSRTAFPNSCLASSAAEAAGLLGGLEGYWKMHDWLMSNRTAVNDQSVLAAAEALGFEPAAFTTALADPKVKAAIEEDCRAIKPSAEGQPLYLWRGSIPTIFINGRIAPRWKLDNEVVVDKILDVAYAGDEKTARP